jgi:general secretion pathway protein D
VRAEQVDPENIQQIDTGTTNNIELRPISSPQQLSAALQSTTLTAVTPQNNAPANAAQQVPPPGTVPPPPTAATAAQQAMTNMQQQANPIAPALLQISPPQSAQAMGSTFKMIVNLSGGTDVFAVPLNVQYDASKLTLLNVDTDDPQNPNILGKDGQAVALAHRDDGKGNAAIAASRPPGTRGVTGSGTLCVLTFQTKAPGDASVAIVRPMVRNSQQQPMPATGSQAVVHIQ